MKIEKITPQIAALYLGAKCDLEWLYTDTVDNLFVSGDIWKDIDIRPTSIQLLIDSQARITPHLRRLDSITEQEARDIYTIFYGLKSVKSSPKDARYWLLNSEDERLVSPIDMIVGDSDALLYLLSKGFDLFGLIEAGLAKEIKPETVNA